MKIIKILLRIILKKIGYVWVFDYDQNEYFQIDVLKQVGCDVIYGDYGVLGVVKKCKGFEEFFGLL